jgi:hypothetical protein
MAASLLIINLMLANLTVDSVKWVPPSISHQTNRGDQFLLNIRAKFKAKNERILAAEAEMMEKLRATRGKQQSK